MATPKDLAGLKPALLRAGEERALKVIVIPLGSAGDVHPLLGIALQLRERGHEILFATNGHFGPLAKKAGLAFEELGTAEDYDRALKDPDLWHPTRGTKKVLTWTMAGLLRPAFDLIQRNLVPGETVVVGAALCLGARVAHDKLGFPLITTQLQPLSIYSHVRPARFPAMPPWAPPWMVNAMFWIGEKLVVNPTLLPPLNDFRKELGLAPLRGGIFTDYINSPQRILGLFADWFADAPPDWPKHLRMPGFPMYDEKGVTAVEPELDAFLSAGTPPVAFTPGSAMLHGREFFTAAAEACAKIGRRGLLLTRYPENIPPSLPNGVRHFHYAPFSAILPRCAALVHHGGIGTMAQAFATGIPQVLMPMAHDQFDNADRAEKLGLALTVPRAKFKSARVAATLKTLLETPSFSQNAKSVSKRFEGLRPIDAACDEIEAFAREKGVLRVRTPNADRVAVGSSDRNAI